ncbi:hypothetical protein F2P79_004302 [Pimephales promelas]|nr:hypothetical protein F2P79_004302 [Pimephales promelas]
MALQLIEKVHPDPDSNKTNHGQLRSQCDLQTAVRRSGSVTVVKGALALCFSAGVGLPLWSAGGGLRSRQQRLSVKLAHQEAFTKKACQKSETNGTTPSDVEAQLSPPYHSKDYHAWRDCKKMDAVDQGEGRNPTCTTLEFNQRAPNRILCLQARVGVPVSMPVPCRCVRAVVPVSVPVCTCWCIRVVVSMSFSVRISLRA